MCIVCDQLGLSTPLPRSTKDIDTTDPSPGAEGIGDSLYPGFGNSGYDAQNYTLVGFDNKILAILTGTQANTLSASVFTPAVAV